MATAQKRRNAEAFARLRSDVLLQILEVVERAGATLAAPPQPLQLLREQ